MITIQNLTKKYRGGDELALNGLTAKIRPGSITAVLGPNGSGKTTLFRLLAGHDFATDGDIRIGGRSIATDARIPYFAVAHEGNNFGEARMRDYLAFARTRPGWNESEYGRLAERFSVPAPRKQVSKLSLGQQSSFAIAVALASGAPIVLIDEAHAGMDVPKRNALYEELIRANAEQGRTIVIASHHVGELERVVEDVLIIDRGRIAEATTAEAVSRRFARVLGPREQVLAAVGARPVRSTRQLGPTEEWVVDVAAEPLTQVPGGVMVSPVDFQDAFVALIESGNDLKEESR
ncbi:ATP-binding cassette domain-containing protein [Gulosibacter molinativorax]|uniref:ABC transporter ATP-binding protein n=1 Tax=Gulosibacter molinativorax TaxID=256821 RepID=A0ABT7CAG5_9MICO|nr:ABC transporter ATP-binding protein [Gulosibacter molinativorax]MDJ1372185.1 ABC transporter ATP-binding protein [Gulosibacter molinativorax]QUY60944.1 Hypotetical protein [Gulosibacter molinativorax]